VPPVNSIANLALSLAVFALSLGAALFGANQDSLFVHRNRPVAAALHMVAPGRLHQTPFVACGSAKAVG
jgi:hypothetical protein